MNFYEFKTYLTHFRSPTPNPQPLTPVNHTLSKLPVNLFTAG